MIAIDWVNTPGSYYAFAYWLSSWVIITNSHKRKDIRERFFSTSLLVIALGVFMTVTHGSSNWFYVPVMMSCFSMIWLTIAYNCKYDWKTSLYFTARAFIIGELIASLEWEFYYYGVEYLGLPTKFGINLLFCMLVDGVVALIMYYLEKKNRAVNENIIVNDRELLSAGAITLMVYVISNISYVLDETPLGSLLMQELFMIRTLVDFAGVAILYAYHLQMGELNLKFEMDKMQDILNMQYHNYEMLEQSISVVNQKYHDLKYQITLLKDEVKGQERMAYLDQMEQEIKAYEAQNKTGNKIFDTILTGKALQCQNNWIELTSVADGHLLDFMDPMDISTLFGNLLDNAIESVCKIEHKERRLIHLTLSKEKNFLRIRMENCYEKKPDFVKGLPMTSKSNKRMHGFGLKSVQSTVKKYNGSFKIQAKEGWFEIRILIPLVKDTISV